MTENRLKPVYLIFGAHRLLLDEALSRLAATIADGGPMNISRFDGAGPIDDIIGACQALSFFGDRRLIVVADVLSLAAQAQSTLADYVQDPNPQTILVMTQVAADKKEQGRLKNSSLYKACDGSKSAGVSEYSIKSGLPSWLKTAFAARGKTAGMPIIDYLLTWVGTDLDNLSMEIDKICAAAGDDEITVDLLRKVVTANHSAEVFDLVNAVIDRRAADSLSCLATLLAASAGSDGIFGLLERQFSLILRTKTTGKGLKGQQLAAKLGTSAGQAFFLEKQSRSFSVSALKRSMRLLAECDFARKSSSAPEAFLMERLVVDLCRV